MRVYGPPAGKGNHGWATIMREFHDFGAVPGYKVMDSNHHDPALFEERS
jgi:hypothetical protein